MAEGNDDLIFDESPGLGMHVGAAWLPDVISDEPDYEVTPASSGCVRFTYLARAPGSSVRLPSSSSVSAFHADQEIEASAWAPSLTHHHVDVIPRLIAGFANESDRPEFPHGYTASCTFAPLARSLRAYAATRAIGEPSSQENSVSELPSLSLLAIAGVCFGANEGAECGPALVETWPISRRDDDAGGDVVFSAIRAIPRIGRAIAERLIELDRQSREEDPDTGGLSPGSACCLLAFLRATSELSAPRLSLSPDGFIYASWRTGGRTFSLHFLPTGDVKYVLFRPSPSLGARILRSSGVAPAECVLQIPETGGANWIYI